MILVITPAQEKLVPVIKTFFDCTVVVNHPVLLELFEIIEGED